MKPAMVAAAGAAIVTASVCLVFIFGIPANFLIGWAKARIEAYTGYRVRIDGDARIALWPSPRISIRDVALLDGKGSDLERVKADAVRLDLSLGDLLHGRVHITEIAVVRPVLRVALARERVGRAGAAPASAGATEGISVDRVFIEQGAIVFSSERDRLESRIDRINLDLSVVERQVELRGDLYWSDQPIRLEIKTRARPDPEGPTIPLEFALQAPGLLLDPVSATADLRWRNSSLAINGLSGQLGRDNFNGWATVDFTASKPLVKADIDFSRLRFALAPGPDRDKAWRTPSHQPWSDREVDLHGLNFLDAEIQLSASELDLDTFRVAPIAIDATISKGILQADLLRAALYGGEAKGAVSIDASRRTAAHAMRVSLDGVSALPLLTDVADFTWLEGAMEARIDVAAAGASERAILSTLAGAVDVRLRNGAIRGIDVSKLVRDLSTSILDGWQQNANDKTALSQLGVHFRILDGIATTDDFQASGPVVRVTGSGAVDLPGKTLKLKVDPRLVANARTSGASPGATGLGVPVIIEGDWSEPRIYPDIAGILDDPDAAFAQLKGLSKGFFGNSGQRKDDDMIDTLMKGLENIFNEPGGRRRGLQEGQQ